MIIAVDTETFLMQPGLPAPRLVCVSAFDGERGHLFNAEDGLDYVEDKLDRGDTLVFHEAVFDLAVMSRARPRLLEKFFLALRAGRIRCTKIRQKLLDLADGRMRFVIDEETGEFKRAMFTLQAVAKRTLGIDVEKGEDTWRLRYGLLADVPVAEWPTDAREYAITDARVTFGVERYQATQSDSPARQPDGTVVDERPQTRAAFALKLASIWGLRTSREACAALRKQVEAELAAVCEEMLKHGFMRKNGAGYSRVMKKIYEAVQTAYEGRGRKCPMTPGGKPSTEGRDLKKSGDPRLKQLGEASFASRVLSTYLPKLERGLRGPLCTAYNELLDTGRCSSREDKLIGGIAVQTLPRKPGVRECIVPREGFYLAAVDYDQIEMAGLAQIEIDLFGDSLMAELINDGQDLHLVFAADMLGISYEDVVRRYKQAKADKKAGRPFDGEPADKRQQAKPANFGFPGGMGAYAFVDYAEKSWGVTFADDVDEAIEIVRELKRKWIRRFNFWRYFEHWSKVAEQAGDNNATLIQHRSGRIRGGLRYTQLCNGGFQGLVADGAKAGLADVIEEMYTRKDSPIYGSRVVAFVHDEIVAEVPIDVAAEAATRISEVMVAAMKPFIPDVRVAAPPALMLHYSKEADPAFDDRGRLVPWRKAA